MFNHMWSQITTMSMINVDVVVLINFSVDKVFLELFCSVIPSAPNRNAYILIP